ncbi:MAG: hypothetical protein ABW036_11560 [Flavitalea sp.]
MRSPNYDQRHYFDDDQQKQRGNTNQRNQNGQFAEGQSYNPQQGRSQQRWNEDQSQQDWRKMQDDRSQRGGWNQEESSQEWNSRSMDRGYRYGADHFDRNYMDTHEEGSFGNPSYRNERMNERDHYDQRQMDNRSGSRSNDWGNQYSEHRTRKGFGGSNRRDDNFNSRYQGGNLNYGNNQNDRGYNADRGYSQGNQGYGQNQFDRDTRSRNNNEGRWNQHQDENNRRWEQSRNDYQRNDQYRQSDWQNRGDQNYNDHFENRNERSGERMRNQSSDDNPNSSGTYGTSNYSNQPERGNSGTDFNSTNRYYSRTRSNDFFE